MDRKQVINIRTVLGAACMCGVGLFASCGGDTGNERDSGTEKTTLSVAATDPDGDTLSYEWRVTAGTVDNRNASQTVWTLPPGRGLHFAYVLVTDGKGGYAKRQYAVNTDALDTAAPVPAPVAYPIAASAPTFDGTTLRLRLRQGDKLLFSDVDSGPERHVYLPDAAVRVSTGASVVFSGNTDLAGEVNLPSLPLTVPPDNYKVECASASGGLFSNCASFSIDAERSSVVPVTLGPAAATNLRLHGHVSLGDDSLCGTHDEYFGIQTSATVQVLDAAGAPLTPKRRVNRFGDYAIQAPTQVDQRLTLRVECGTDRQDIDLPADTDAALRSRLVGQLPIERSVRFTNRPPVIGRVVANGPDGNVRGREVLEEVNAVSIGLPGHARFLSYKGTDSALSACNYYRSIGAVSGCDAQGRLLGAISLDDWKRRHHFAPYVAGNTEVAATYINQRDLNLVRRMTATQTAPDSIAFVVCNNPGPEGRTGRTQAEVDQVIDFGLADERKVACVAMEWSVSPGVNGGAPFTKFLTFGPDGALIPSVNLDGRGEKFMPGACIACHGGSKVDARFPETGNPSPLLGAKFLPFDTGNFLFSTRGDLTEASQGAALRDLNRLVVLTEGLLPAEGTPTSNLVAGWYSRPDKPTELDNSYVPGAPGTGWRVTDAKAQFYREVIGTSCRTCHTALGSAFNWDGAPGRFDGNDGVVARHFCGGTADLATNASMPNALAALNRLLDPQRADLGTLKALMPSYLGCDGPKSDPVFARK